MIYASEIACSAAGLEPRGDIHQGARTCCAMCGRPIVAGDLSSPVLLNINKVTFTDLGRLSASDYLCGFCPPTIVQTISRKFQRAVITPQGVYSMNTDEARAWLWTSPPPAPFVVIINSNSTATFHYLWQTPVTLDNRLIAVNFDGVVAHISRDRIGKALLCAKQVHDHALAQGHKKVSSSPFTKLSRDFFKSASGSHGRFHALSELVAEQAPECAASLAFLRGLSAAELTALSCLLKANPSQPVQPRLLQGAALFEKDEQIEVPEEAAT